MKELLINGMSTLMGGHVRPTVKREPRAMTCILTRRQCLSEDTRCVRE
jgi:hypothetical protein